jgi:hypothetical protein
VVCCNGFSVFSLTNREKAMNDGGTMRIIRGTTLFLALLLIAVFSEQLIPLVVATVAGMLVVMFERLTR